MLAASKIATLLLCGLVSDFAKCQVLSPLHSSQHCWQPSANEIKETWWVSLRGSEFRKSKKSKIKPIIKCTFV